MKSIITLIFCLNSLITFGQKVNETYIKDLKNGCKVWYENYAPGDSISWKGSCKGKFAEGPGTLIWYGEGKETARYSGLMHKGKPNGRGKYTYLGNGEVEGKYVEGVLQGIGSRTFPTGLKLEGRYIDDEFLSMDEPVFKLLKKHLTAFLDSTDIYVNDGDSKSLFYYTIEPKADVKGYCSAT